MIVKPDEKNWSTRTKKQLFVRFAARLKGKKYMIKCTVSLLLIAAAASSYAGDGINEKAQAELISQDEPTLHNSPDTSSKDRRTQVSDKESSQTAMDAWKKKKTKFSFSISYGNSTGQYNNSVGPVVSCGIDIKNRVYLGIEPTATAFEAPGGEGTSYVFGVGATCLGEIKAGNIFLFNFGGSLGYWAEHSSKIEQLAMNEIIQNATYYGGPQLKIGIGYKYVYGIFRVVNFLGVTEHGDFAHATSISFGLQGII